MRDENLIVVIGILVMGAIAIASVVAECAQHYQDQQTIQTYHQKEHQLTDVVGSDNEKGKQR